MYRLPSSSSRCHRKPTSCRGERPLVVIINQAAPRSLRRIGESGAGEERRVFLTGTFTNAETLYAPLTVLTPVTFEGFVTGGTYFVTVTPNQPLVEPIQVGFSFGFGVGGLGLASGTVTVTVPETFSFQVREDSRGFPVYPSSNFFIYYTILTPTPSPVNLTVQVLSTSFVAVV